MLDDFQQIIYIVIIDDIDPFQSAFSGFNIALFDKLPVFNEIINFPNTIYEIGRNGYSKAKIRLNYETNHSIIPLLYESYKIFEPSMPFYCVIYDKKKYPDLETIQKVWKYVPLFIDINTINQIKEKDFYAKYNPSVNAFLKKNLPGHQITYNSKLEPELRFPFDGISMQLLMILPCILRKGKSIDPVKMMMDANDFVHKTYNLDKPLRRNITCVFTTMPFLALSYVQAVLISKIPNNERKVVKHIITQKNYILDTDYNSKYFNTRIAEIDLYRFCMRLVFDRYMCPLIQFEPGIQTRTLSYVKDLNNIDDTHENMYFKNLINKINEYTHKEFFTYLDTKEINNIKIYSDAPIEFVLDPRYNLPLSVTTNFCKIPVTDGTDFFLQIARMSNTYLEVSDLKKILIIRSFEDDSEIKDALVNEFNRKNLFDKLSITVKDVKDSDDVVAVLNATTDYSICIFDCHGYQNGSENHGILSLENGKFDIWNERYRVTHVPHIVLFSACLTNFYNSNEYSVANGFMAAGAKMVLATNSRVDAFSSARFLSRILVKICDFFDTNVLTDKIYLSNFFSNQFRIFYVEDVLNFYKIAKKDSKKILQTVEFCIQKKSSHWFDTLIYALSNLLGRSTEELKENMIYEVGYCESLKYVLLGNADCLILNP